MSNGYGLSRALEGAAEGLQKGLDRREQEKEFARRDIEFQQGQEDRDYMMERREVEDTRADDQYRIQKGMQQRFNAGNEALRDFMLYGNVDSVQKFMNTYSPDGMEHKLEKNPDGSYQATMSYEGRTDSKTVDADDIGTAMQIYMTSDPYAKLEERIATERASATAKLDREHDKALITQEYDRKEDIEHIKGGYKVAAAKGDGSGPTLQREKHRLQWQKELDDLATKDYGTMFGDQWKFDTTREKSMKSAQADLAGVYYMKMEPGQEDTNAANRQALADMRIFQAEAVNQADEEMDKGSISRKQYDNRVADIIDQKVDKKISSMAPKPAELQRQGQDASQNQTQGRAPIPEGAMKMLRDNKDNEDIRKAFDEKYGPGSADKVLGAPDQSSDGAAVTNASPVRTAEADTLTGEEEAEAPKTKRPSEQEVRKKIAVSQEKRTELRRSRKDHQKIALSEYKNEWKQMSDKEKLAWWSDNAGALKAKSERSWRKAKKEIRQIKSAERFGKAPGTQLNRG